MKFMFLIRNVIYVLVIALTTGAIFYQNSRPVITTTISRGLKPAAAHRPAAAEPMI